MNLSKKTKKLRATYLITTIVSLLLWAAPIGTFVVMALVKSEFLYQKAALSLSVLTVVIMTIVALSAKIALRSRLWVLLIGVYICLDNILTMIVIFAACQIIDEMIVAPIRSRAKRRLEINRELDARLET